MDKPNYSSAPLSGTRDRSRERQSNFRNAPHSRMTRREFVGLAVASAFTAGFSQCSWAADAKGEMPYRKLGRIGERVSIVGLGGYHIGMPSLLEREAIRIIRTVIDNGINFLDNCWDYYGGESEVRMGKALRDGYRQEAFLMTKIDRRTRRMASQQLEESLRRFQTDHVDLIQFHELIRMSDPDHIFASGGGIEAVLEAKNGGEIRYIGFTGHESPDNHLKMLETAFANKFQLDAVPMLNLMDVHYNSFKKKVLPALVKHEVGVLGMKPMRDRMILESVTVPAIECLHDAMSLPTSVVITGYESMPTLQQALDAARSFRPLELKEVNAMRTKTAQAAQEGKFELYKTTHNFDGPFSNPQWLG